MQIHELTKRCKTNEGLLDNIKSAVSAAKTGYAAGKAGTGSTLGAAGTALGTFGKAITDPSFAAQSNVDANSKAAMDKYNALKKKYGWQDKGDQTQAGGARTAQGGQQSAAPNNQAVQQQAKVMTQQFAQSLEEPDLADLTAVLPDPGKVLYVEMPAQVEGGQPTKYYKDDKGVWRNEDFTPIKGGATNLEAMIDQGKYGQSAPPSAATPAAQPTQGKKAQAQQPAAQQAPQQAAPAQQVEEATNPRAMKVSSIVNRIIKQNKNAEQKELKATIDQAKADPKAKANIDRAYQQVLNATALTASKAKTRQQKKQAVVKAFSNYANTALTQAAQVGQEGSQQGTDQEATQQGTTNPVAQSAAANKLAIQGLDKQTIDKVKQVAKKDPTSVKQALGLAEHRKPLTQRLEEALQMLSEAQVYITKDIHVRTAGGDYIKRASDQQWYDPKGVRIDPDKYAEYIAKLDRTPQAQTQYQADAQNAAKGKGPGGTDAGAQKAAQTPPPPQAPAAAAAPAPQQPDPLQQMADQQKMQQWLRGRDVAGLNAQIADTTKQLRNAQIFGTGQEQYLQQQLAQLIAMKV